MRISPAMDDPKAMEPLFSTIQFQVMSFGCFKIHPTYQEI
jgi:hypothetical protein